MTYETWPASLPQYVEEQGYGEGLPALSIESQTDSGQSKVRRRFTANWRPLQISIRCDAEQADDFEAFWRDTLQGGVHPFWWKSPFTQRTALMRFKGGPPQKTPFGAVHTLFRFQLFQMRALPDFRFDSATVTFDSTARSFDEAFFY